MATAGPNSPGTLADAGTPAGNTWSNPTNAGASDDTYATVTTIGAAVSHYLQGTNLGFAVPAGATINGVTVTIERKRTGTTNVKDSTVSLVKGGTVQGTNKASASSWPTSDGTATYGSTSDLWGLTLTASDVNASDFGVVLSTVRNAAKGNGQASVDLIQIAVDYTVAAGAPGGAAMQTVVRQVMGF